MDDSTDRQYLRKATSSISTCIVKVYEKQPSMDNVDVDNVTQMFRAITEWLDNVQVVWGSDSWPAFETPAVLFPDIYKESTVPKANPKLRPGDQSVLLLCWALQGMVELSASEDITTPNWRYGYLPQTAHYVLWSLNTTQRCPTLW